MNKSARHPAGNLGKFLHSPGSVPKMLAKDVLQPKPKPSAPQPAVKNAGPVKAPKPLSGFGIQ